MRKPSVLPGIHLGSFDGFLCYNNPSILLFLTSFQECAAVAISTNNYARGLGLRGRRSDPSPPPLFLDKASFIFT